MYRLFAAFVKSSQ